MGESTTIPSTAGVPDFLAAVADPRRRAGAQVACDRIAETTGAEPVMWGTTGTT